MYGPITTEPSRAKANVLYTLVDPVSPPPKPACSAWILVEAPGTAPGSERFIATSVYRHSRLAPAPRIYAIAGGEKRADSQGEFPSAGAAKFGFIGPAARSAPLRFWRFWRPPRFRSRKQRRRFRPPFPVPRRVSRWRRKREWSSPRRRGRRGSESRFWRVVATR